MAFTVNFKAGNYCAVKVMTLSIANQLGSVSNRCNSFDHFQSGCFQLLSTKKLFHWPPSNPPPPQINWSTFPAMFLRGQFWSPSFSCSIWSPPQMSSANLKKSQRTCMQMTSRCIFLLMLIRQMTAITGSQLAFVKCGKNIRNNCQTNYANDSPWPPLMRRAKVCIF